MRAPTNTNTTATSFVMGCSLFTSTGETRGGIRVPSCNPAFSFPQQIARQLPDVPFGIGLPDAPSLKLSSLKSQGLRIGIGRYLVGVLSFWPTNLASDVTARP